MQPRLSLLIFDPPASASQVAKSTGTYYSVQIVCNFKLNLWCFCLLIKMKAKYKGRALLVCHDFQDSRG